MTPHSFVVAAPGRDRPHHRSQKGPIMPTFYDPAADSTEAAEALRGLAHASRHFDYPRDLHPVIGDLLASTRSLRQTLDQLAAAHIDHRSRAHDDAGDHLTGAHDALAAADELHQAGTLLDAVTERLDAASQATSRIAWHDPLGHEAAQTLPPVREDPTHQGPAHRWVSVAFLQGEDADTVLDVIDRDGVEAGLDHMTGFDYGTETTDAALENGHVYDDPPSGMLDREADRGDYRMVYNPQAGHVALYRQHTIDPADQLPPEPGLGTRELLSRPAGSAGGPAVGQAGLGRGAAASAFARESTHKTTTDRGASGRDGSWFAHRGVAAVKRDRGLGL